MVVYCEFECSSVGLIGIIHVGDKAVDYRFFESDTIAQAKAKVSAEFEGIEFTSISNYRLIKDDDTIMAENQLEGTFDFNDDDVDLDEYITRLPLVV